MESIGRSTNHCLCLCMALTVYHCITVTVSVCHCHCLCVSLSLSLYVAHCVSLCHCHYLCMSLTVYHCVTVTQACFAATQHCNNSMKRNATPLTGWSPSLCSSLSSSSSSSSSSPSGSSSTFSGDVGRCWSKTENWLTAGTMVWLFPPDDDAGIVR